MIFVDKRRFEQSDFRTRYGELAGLEAPGKRDGRLYAVCLKHPFDIVSTVLFMRDRDQAVLLMNGDTPLEAAKEIAVQAEANYLFYESWNNVIPICGEAPHHPPGLLQYSSGTTGRPKLISRSWQDIDTEIESYNIRLDSAHEDRPIILVPVSHSFGLIAGALTAIAREIEPQVIWDKNPKYALHAIRDTPRSLVYGVPFIFHVLDSLARGTLRFHKLLSSGAPLSEALFHRLSRSADEVWQQYGSSETGCIALGARPASPFDVGAPLKHIELSFIPLAESDGAEIQPGGAETGVDGAETKSNEAEDQSDGAGSEWREIVVSSRFGRVRTGDIGCLAASGSLCLMGRSDDMINVSGLKVIPAEVENVIERMPGVAEAAVHKTRHKVWGEAARALVVAASDVREEQIRAWCIRHLPAYKVPGSIRLVKEIPKMPSGKLSRKLLQELEC